MSQKKIKACVHCSESFEAKRKNHTYCSKSCVTMACYKRKGYVYRSGRYVKPDAQQENLDSPAMAGTELSKQAAPPAVMAMPDLKGMGVGMSRGSDEITMAGIAENALGSGIVAAVKHMLVDQHNEKTLQQIHAMLVEVLRFLKQGQGNPQPAQMGIQSLPNQQGMKPLGKPEQQKPDKGSGGEWM